MSSKTRIVVLRLKEVVCTGIFVILGILLIVLLVVFFLPKEKKTTQTNALASDEISYIPGVYTTSLQLDGSTIALEVTIDDNYISSVAFTDMDEMVKTFYPLLEPALSDIASQLIETQSLDKVSYSDDMRYTSMVLIEAIDNALEEAKKGN